MPDMILVIFYGTTLALLLLLLVVSTVAFPILLYKVTVKKNEKVDSKKILVNCVAT